MRMFEKGQFKMWLYRARTEISFINEQFGLYSLRVPEMHDLSFLK